MDTIELPKPLVRRLLDGDQTVYRELKSLVDAADPPEPALPEGVYACKTPECDDAYMFVGQQLVGGKRVVYVIQNGDCDDYWEVPGWITGPSMLTANPPSRGLMSEIALLLAAARDRFLYERNDLAEQIDRVRDAVRVHTDPPQQADPELAGKLVGALSGVRTALE